MNSIEDLQQIVSTHYRGVGEYLSQQHEAKPEEYVGIFREAQRRAETGLVKLRKLKLKQEDRVNMKYLRKAFELLIKSCEKGSKGNHRRAKELSEEAQKFYTAYTALGIQRAVSSFGSANTRNDRS